jgi:hypothetical protein
MVTDRKSKWQRATHPERLFLQDRDQCIITSVGQFGFLTRSQIQRLFDFPCVTRINSRLRRLFDNGYLERRFLPTTRGTSQTLYFLGPQGIDLVILETGIDVRQVKKRHELFFARKEMFLAHDLLANDIRIATERVLANRPEMKLDLWVGSADCLQEWTSGSSTGRSQKMAFRPDGYFRYYRDGKLFGCFLEVDRSTMSGSRFQSKVGLYLSYARSGLYPQKYGLQYFRVLVTTETKERLANLKSATANMTDKMFWFALTDDAKAGKVFETIWERPGRERAISLLE